FARVVNCLTFVSAPSYVSISARTLLVKEPCLASRIRLPPLVRAALVHVQFETIHPYLDGNGLIGRLLITLLLEHWKLLTEPLLYLSLFFKRHRPEYYRLLNAVCLESDWEASVSSWKASRPSPTRPPTRRAISFSWSTRTAPGSSLRATPQ